MKKNIDLNKTRPKVIEYRIIKSSLADMYISTNYHFIPADICIHANSNHDSIPADICVPNPDDKTPSDSIFFSQSSRESFQSFPDKYPPSLPNSLYCSTFNYSPSPCSESSLSHSKCSSLSSRNFLSSQVPSVSTSSTRQNCVHIPSDITQKCDSLSFNDYANSEITSYNSSKKFPSTIPVIKDEIRDRKLVLLLLKPLQK